MHEKSECKCACKHQTEAQDVEKDGFDPGTHVTMRVAGMDCSSCSRKGLKVLERIKGVRNANINFVSSTGEFSVGSESDVASVISQFERETTFRCARIMKDLQTLDLTMTDKQARKFDDKSLDGVYSIWRSRKGIYSIDFDPKVTSARSLLQSASPGTQLAPPQENKTHEHEKARLRRLAWSTGLAAILTIPVLILAWGHTSLPHEKRAIGSLILATCVQAIAVPEFYVGAMKSLVFSRIIEMDMLIVISITTAYAYSVTAFAFAQRGHALGSGDIFETSALLITLVMLGRLISAIARTKAQTAVSMKSFQPKDTILLHGHGGRPTRMDARLIGFGDVLLIPSHTTIVTDGTIISGESTIDESLMTGENCPVAKGPGDMVTAGTLNGSSPLTIYITRLPGQNSIADVSNLVQDALEAKPRIQDLADTVASWLVPAVVCLALLVFTVWIIIALRYQQKSAGGSVGVAITYAIAVLAISCPCALGLAVPMVLVVAGGVAAKLGIVVKRASVTERAFRTTDVVFDKTGTLTTGVLQVVQEVHFSKAFEPWEVQPALLALLRSNEHPVSAAVARHVELDATKPDIVTNLVSIPGAGIKADWQDHDIKAGNAHWLLVDHVPVVESMIERGLTVLCFTVGHKLIAAYGLESTLRPEAVGVVEALHKESIICHIVSGDGDAAVEGIAKKLGIESMNTAARQSPSAKVDYVNSLIERGSTVLFCGDGTNDAAAVAQAHVGVEIGSKSDITQASADVVLLGGLDGVITLLDISKAAFSRIIFNFVWSGIYNFFAILLAAGAFVKVRIPPEFAGLGEIVSVLPVILLALSLTKYRKKAIGQSASA